MAPSPLRLNLSMMPGGRLPRGRYQRGAGSATSSQTRSTTSLMVRTLRNFSGLNRRCVNSCNCTTRSTASMLSMSRSSYRRAFGTTFSAGTSKNSPRQAVRCFRISSRDSMFPSPQLRPHEFRQRSHIDEMTPYVVAHGFDLEAVSLAQGHAKLQRINGVQSQTLDE